MYTDMCAYAWATLYLDIFSTVPHKWSWVSTKPVGSSIPTRNQTGRETCVAFFREARAWTWTSTAHSSLFLHNSLAVCNPTYPWGALDDALKPAVPSAY